MILPYLTIASSANRGRGVYTTEPIQKGTVIEVSPVIVMSPEERIQLEKTLLHDYIFEWDVVEKSAAVALGYLSIYNHSNEPNCAYEMDFDHEMISIKTLSDIEKGAELFINYMHAEGPSSDPVWFELK